MIDDDDVTLEHGPVTRHVTLIPVLGTDWGGGGGVHLYLLLSEAGPMGLGVHSTFRGCHGDLADLAKPLFSSYPFHELLQWDQPATHFVSSGGTHGSG